MTNKKTQFQKIHDDYVASGEAIYKTFTENSTLNDKKFIEAVEAEIKRLNDAGYVVVIKGSLLDLMAHSNVKITVDNVLSFKDGLNFLQSKSAEDFIRACSVKVQVYDLNTPIADTCLSFVILGPKELKTVESCWKNLKNDKAESKARALEQLKKIIDETDLTLYELQRIVNTVLCEYTLRKKGNYGKPRKHTEQ